MFLRFASILTLWLALSGFDILLTESRKAALEELPAAERLVRLEELRTRFPGDRSLLDMHGTALWGTMSNLDGEARILAVKSYLRQDPENAVLSKLLGDAYFDWAHAEGGITYLDSSLFAYENAALKDPGYLPAVGSVGRVYDEKGNTEEAIVWYEKVLGISPEHVPTLCNIGASHYSQGARDVAVSYYRKALAIDPRNQDAHYNLGVAFAEAQIYREAVVEWETVTAIDPSTPIGQMAAENAKLLRDVIKETEYRAGRRVRRLQLEEKSSTAGNSGPKTLTPNK